MIKCVTIDYCLTSTRSELLIYFPASTVSFSGIRKGRPRLFLVAPFVNSHLQHVEIFSFSLPKHNFRYPLMATF